MRRETATKGTIAQIRDAIALKADASDLGGAAALDVGTTEGTVKAGDWQPDLSGCVSAGRARALATATGRLSNLTVMASPPTIASGMATQDAALTHVYAVTTTPAAFTTCGGVPTIASTSFWTFPVVTCSSGNGNVGAGKTANGFAVEFMADADKVEVRFLKGTSARGIQIEVDGQKIGASSITYPVDAGSTFYVLLTFASRAVRHIRAEASDYGGFRSVAVAPTASVWASTDPGEHLTMAVVGDSLCAQIGATEPNGGWASAFGKLLGIRDVWQVAHPGTGFTTGGVSDGTSYGDARRIADVVAADPDIVVIEATGNDPSATVGAAALITLRAYRTALPGVPIIVGGLWAGASGPNAERLAVDAAVKAAFATWADPLSWWVDAMTYPWIFGTGRVGATNASGNSDVYVGTDAVHPTQSGHDFYGARWAAAVRDTILPLL